jgi:hypothetical protein
MTLQHVDARRRATGELKASLRAASATSVGRWTMPGESHPNSSTQSARRRGRRRRSPVIVDDAVSVRTMSAIRRQGCVVITGTFSGTTTARRWRDELRVAGGRLDAAQESGGDGARQEGSSSCSGARRSWRRAAIRIWTSCPRFPKGFWGQLTASGVMPRWSRAVGGMPARSSMIIVIGVGVVEAAGVGADAADGGVVRLGDPVRQLPLDGRFDRCPVAADRAGGLVSQSGAIRPRRDITEPDRPTWV